MQPRGQIPIGIDGDPVVDRIDKRVFTQLSKPSPLHKNPDTTSTNAVSASIARILDETRDVDDGDDDLTFLARLTNAPQVFPKFPMPKEGSLTQFERKTIQHPVTGTLQSWRDPNFLPAAVWRDLWWTSAGHRRVICNILSFKRLDHTEVSLPSKGEQLIRADVSVDVVVCTVDSQGLATARVKAVVAADPRGTKRARDGDIAPAEPKDEDNDNEASPANSNSAAAVGSSGVVVRILSSAAAGFGARQTAESEAFSDVFVRADAGQVRNLKEGDKVLVAVELSTLILHVGGCPRGSEGEWQIVLGTAATAGEDEDDDLTLDQLADKHKSGPSPTAANASAVVAASPPATRRQKKGEKYDVALQFVLDPNSKEAQMELRREEMKRAAKAQAAKAGRGGRR
jgi:hypothetical protein